MGCRVSEHHTLIHELLRAANQLPSLNVSEKASLIDRAMAALLELRQEAYARHVDVHDVIDLKPMLSTLVSQLPQISDSQLKEVLLLTAECLRCLGVLAAA